MRTARSVPVSFYKLKLMDEGYGIRKYICDVQMYNAIYEIMNHYHIIELVLK